MPVVVNARPRCGPSSLCVILLIRANGKFWKIHIFRVLSYKVPILTLLPTLLMELFHLLLKAKDCLFVSCNELKERFYIESAEGSESICWTDLVPLF